MAKVPLRAYVREIKDLIENEHLEEAIAHCLHILKTFPMYVDAYRLLGEALLEARRYSDAADIFRRVLAAVPDDFIAHLGMSIARESENKLDEAIWHMERAFEMQPSNPAVQGELRRLYGRRDGVEPLKIRLSRDALANMYLRGELYSQAIAELRSLLSEDPQRPDLQVMLGRAYFHAGRKTEAIETCATLLQKYPYCLDALRIMSDVLPGTGHAENAQAYRGRLRNLDPYSAFATGSVFQSDQVADNAVTLEHLEYQPGERAVPPHAEWAASLGIQLEEGGPSQTEIPEWLTGAAQAREIPQIPAVEAPPESLMEDRIPDWMRVAGWGEATGAAVEDPLEVETGEPSSLEAASVADIPDWLRAMAPAGMLGPSSPAGEMQPPSEEAPDLEWLKSLEVPHLPEAASAEGGETLETVPASAGEEAPDWLQGMMAEGGVPAEGGETLDAVPASAGEEAPDWLQGMMAEGGVPAERGETLETVPASAGEEAPDWLQGMMAEGGVPAEGGETLDAVPASAGEEVPDWLQGMMAEGSVPAEGGETLETVPASAGEVEGEEVLDWLKGLAVEDAAPVIASAEVSAAESGIEGELPAPEVEMVATTSSMEATSAMAEEGENILDGSDALAWLEALAARQGARADELITDPEARPAEETPEWVRRLAEESGAPPERPEMVMESKTAESPAGGSLPLEEMPLSEEGDLEEPAPEEEEEPPLEIPQIFPEPPEPAVVTGQEVVAETTPAWSQELLEAESGGMAVEAVEPAEELPDWLRALAEEEVVAPVAAVEEEIPDWLRAEFARGTGASEVVSPGSAEEEITVLPEEMAAEEVASPVKDETALEVERTIIPAAEEEAPAWLEAEEQRMGGAQEEKKEELPEWLATEIGEETTIPSTVLAVEEPAWAGREAMEEMAAVPLAPAVEEEPLPSEEAVAGWAGKEAALETEIEPAMLLMEEEPLPPEEVVAGWAGKEAALEAETTPAAPLMEEEPLPPKEAVAGWAGKEAALEAETTPAAPLMEEEPLPSEEAVAGWAGGEAALEAEMAPAVPLMEEEPLPSEEAIAGWAGKEAALEAETTPAAPLPLMEEEPLPSEEAVAGWAGGEAALETETILETPTPGEVEEPLAEVPQPTMPEEWMPEIVEEAEVSGPLGVEETTIPLPEQPAIAPPVPAGARGTKPAAGAPKENEMLIGAQTALRNGQLVEAMQDYGRLIRKGKFLEEIIHDLHEATYRYPVEVIVWQTLGDAYMRANQLQDALDAYTKAEELLR